MLAGYYHLVIYQTVVAAAVAGVVSVDRSSAPVVEGIHGGPKRTHPCDPLCDTPNSHE